MPEPAELQLSRHRGRGIVVDTAPPRTLMALTVLANGAWWGTRIQGPDLVNVAEQVLYKVTGYDPEHAALVLELVEDWRPSVKEQRDA